MVTIKPNLVQFTPENLDKLEMIVQDTKKLLGIKEEEINKTVIGHIKDFMNKKIW